MADRFEVTEDHLKLLRRASVGWQDCESGAPEIHPKRPYGNSFVPGDVAEILGWPPHSGEDDEGGLSEYQIEKARTVHRETETVLQIVLCVGEFRAGIYERSGWRDWKRTR